MRRSLLLALASLALVVAAFPISAEAPGSCVHHRGTLGVTVTLSRCLPTADESDGPGQDCRPACLLLA
jgi:hypothetical protein